MTKHYELIDSIPRNIYLAKMFTDLPFIFANMRKYGISNSNQGVDGGDLSNKIVKWSIFIFSAGTQQEKLALLIFLRSFCLDQGTSSKTTPN